MKCPFCDSDESRVVDSRSSGDGRAIRRRRECQSCRRRYTTYERHEEVPKLIVKKDRRREPFSRQKILQGLLKACEKRNVPMSRLEEVVDRVERKINEEFDYEVEARYVGGILVEELKKIDQVAYVRFASVYQEFADVTEFLRELQPLIAERVTGDGALPAGEEELGERPASGGESEGSNAR